MKKLISIIGAVSLTAIGTSSVIACSGGKPKPVQPLTPTTIPKIAQPVETQPKEKIDISSLKIDAPNKIIAKNIRKVSKDEYLPLIKSKIHEALDNFDKSLKWSKGYTDLEIDLNFLKWFDKGHLDLSTPKTGTLWIKGINNATGFTEITITLPIATEL
ncbi:lipoprotein [Spiroplasma sp. hyd1]|uniref:lipoprotein n=1 Tax=Spiroplasma sp. hyd1 TaxID=1609976 RepID=UPI0018DB6158|nr:lipoprotein [Spiroplasma sp. hyd1]MBH8623227.1 hypothetical protein [Spiroplasma sp. hyd1]